MIRTQNNKMVYITTLNGENFTPYSLFCKLKGIALLESASFGRGKGRYSIILLKEAFSAFQKDEKIFIKRDGLRYHVKSKIKDILDVSLYFSKQHKHYNYLFPFPIGGIGYLSYEYVRHFDDINLCKKKDSLGIPDAYLIFGHTFLIFDHYNDTILLVVVNYNEYKIDLQKEANKVQKEMHDLNFNYLNAETTEYTAIPLNLNSEHDMFIAGVKRIKREIIKGNLLQGVLSRRLIVHTDIPAIEVYRRLRSLNPSPYMFYIDFKDFQLFGSSPEVHVKVNENKVIMRPIAGTRSRGKDKKEDEKFEKELLQDEKERAEHLMLVDLVRNDLGRICSPGSITVTEFMDIERYSHVMHIVSQVEGVLREGTNSIDAIRKTFPAGTVSGTPKIRAIEIIDSIEEDTRSFYAGIVGYIEPDGNLDTCINIRSALKSNDLFILQAGAGIVYDSIPEREYQETSAKLKALGKAIGMEV